MTDFPTSRIEVKTYAIYKFCPECSGKPNPGCRLIFKDYKLTMPPLWIHECTNCKKEFNLDNKYPLIVHEEIKEY